MRTDYLAPEKWRVVLATLPRGHALALQIALETGMRIGDVVSLEHAQIDDDGVIAYTAQKTGKSATVKLSRETAEHVRRTNVGRRWVFASRKDPQKHVSRQTVWSALKNAARRLGLSENVGTHSARKTYAVEEFKRTDLETVRDELQHDRITTTMLYAFADRLRAEDPDEDAPSTKDFARSVALEVVRILSENNFIQKRKR